MPAPRTSTWVEINLDVLRTNVERLSHQLAPARLLPVVKANAYGHGAASVARVLERHPAVYALAVAWLGEAEELREAGIKKDIVVLNGLASPEHPAAPESPGLTNTPEPTDSPEPTNGPAAHDRLQAAGIYPVVHRLEEVEELVQRLRPTELRIQLKVDTGLHRMGMPLADVARAAELLSTCLSVRLEALMSHLSDAESGTDATQHQQAQLAEVLRQLEQVSVRPRLIHLANSAASVNFPSARHDLVRVGIAMYGCGAPAASMGLAPALSWRTKVVALRWVEKGERVGYGGSFSAPRKSHVATIAVGYADGLRRSASNVAQVIVGGRLCRIIGNVSMDLAAADVTDVPGCAIGQVVTILGREGYVERTADDLAEDFRTITYEVITGISPRVRRRYIGEECDGA